MLRIDDERDSIRVFFVDYGNTLSVSKRFRGEGDDVDVVMRLPPQLLRPRFRAIECHLADVEPASSTNPELSSPSEVRLCHSTEFAASKTAWSLRAREFFEGVVRDKRLVIHVKSLLLEAEPLVDLWDTSPGLKLAQSASDAAFKRDVPSTSSFILSKNGFPGHSDILLNELLVQQGFGRRLDTVPTPAVV